MRAAVFRECRPPEAVKIAEVAKPGQVLMDQLIATRRSGLGVNSKGFRLSSGA